MRGLSDHDLDQLETLLSALVFGQIGLPASRYRRTACSIAWRGTSALTCATTGTPTAAFCERRTRDQLAAIAVDCGYAESTGRVASYKKAELVNSLIWYFDSARAAAEPTPAQQKAREWLGRTGSCSS